MRRRIEKVNRFWPLPWDGKIKEPLYSFTTIVGQSWTILNKHGEIVATFRVKKAKK